MKSLGKIIEDHIVQDVPSDLVMSRGPLDISLATAGKDEFIGASDGGGSGEEASSVVLERGARHRCGVLQYG